MSPRNELNDPVDMQKGQTRSLTKRKVEGKEEKDDNGASQKRRRICSQSRKVRV